MERDRIVAELHKMVDAWASHPMMQHSADWFMCVRVTLQHKRDQDDALTLVVGTEPAPGRPLDDD